MPVNNGVIELFGAQRDGEIHVTIQYDNTGPADPTQPLVNRGGACLLATNTCERLYEVRIERPSLPPVSFNIPPNGQLSRNAGQLASDNLSTRGDILGAEFREITT